MGVTDQQARMYELEILNRDRSHLPGAVRASLELYNTIEEVDWFVSVVRKIAEGDYSGDYVLDKERGEYHPRNFAFSFDDYFRF
jgi:hypothetical protein